MPNSPEYERWHDACGAYVKKTVARNVEHLLKGFDTAEGADILRAEAAQREGGEDEARRALVRNVENLTKRKAIKDFMARYPPPPKRLPKQRRKKRFHDRRLVSTADLKLARYAFYGSLVALPWISILLPFYFMGLLRRGQWAAQVITYSAPPPDLSARGRRDFDQFVGYINSSLVAGAVYTVLFVVWVCIWQGNITAASPPAWALSLVVGNVDPSW